MPIKILALTLAFLILSPAMSAAKDAAFFSGLWLDSSPSRLLHPVSTQTSRRSRKTLRTEIRNIRFHNYPDHTRLVLDLKRRARYSTQRRQNPKQVVIKVTDAVLGKRARRKLLHKDFPQVLSITDASSRHVTLAIDMAAVKKYKILALTKPHRLVLDLYPASASTLHVRSQANGHQPTSKTLPPTKPYVPPPPSPPGKGLLIVLDPGHGGKDPGALGRRGTREKDIVLNIAKRLRAMIKKRLGAKVLLTREKDVFVELADRANFANEKKADLFVSIHVNSHPKRSVKGLELYHFGEASDPRALEVAARENGTPLDENGPAWHFILADKLTDKKIEDSRELAWTAKKALVKYLRNHYKIKDHGVKTAPFFVLRMTTMPGILAEIAFVSNPTEEKLLRSPTYQKRVAEGIFSGIKAYLTPLQTAAN